jgi:hypothetical protein
MQRSWMDARANSGAIELGDINEAWLGEQTARLFHCLGHQIDVLERGPDPYAVLSVKLALLERYFKVCRLARRAAPERMTPRTKRRLGQAKAERPKAARQRPSAPAS